MGRSVRGASRWHRHGVWRCMLGFGLLSLGTGCAASVDAQTTPPKDSIAATWARPLEPASAEHTQAEPTPEPNPSIRGLSGAAWALAHGRPRTALDALGTVPEPDAGTRPWFLVGAIAGRARLQLGQPAEAMALLQPRLDHRKLSAFLPRDVLAHELATARLQWVYDDEHDLKPAERDATLKQTAELLGDLMRADHIRNLAELRVDRARALAAIEGHSAKRRFWSAKSAQRNLDRIIEDYPDHPDIGEFRLLRAEMLIRQNKPREAASALLAIHIERAGEPESEQAWQRLQKLAKNERSVREREGLSIAEQLDRATWARYLRRVELSRDILDRILGNDDLPRYLTAQAVRSRSYTAYKQRDYAGCAADLWPVFKRTRAVRGELLRCLERAHQYDEAIDIWRDRAKAKRGGARAYALWEAVELSVRAGQYQRASDLLAHYEKLSHGHPTTRRWLHAWLPYRLGDIDAAIEGFERVERRSRGDAQRAHYFRGKLLLRSEEPELRAQGEEILEAMVQKDPLDYYGLQARQRLWDANIDPGPLPELEPMPDEGHPPKWEQTEALFGELVAEFGEGWPALRRAAQLHAAGYIEEARRELRFANEAVLNGRARLRGSRHRLPRSESLYVGLGWKADWRYPRVHPGKRGRRDLRDRERATKLRAGLRKLSLALDEPYYYAKLTPILAYPYKARWYPRAYREAIEREATIRDLDPIHLWSLMYTESRFRRHVVSPVGARGALQIMPWTGRQLAERLGDIEPGDRFNPDRLFDIDYNSRLAAYYISELIKKFHGQAPFAYASYNGGPYNVARWLTAKAGSPEPLEIDTFIEEIPFRETQRYTKRVLEVYGGYSLLYRGAIPEWDNDVDPVVEDNINF